MYDMVEIRDRKEGKILLPLEANNLPYDDFGESYGVVNIGGVSYVLVAEQASNEDEGDVEGRKWKLVHPKTIVFPKKFFERENAALVLNMISPYISKGKLEAIQDILESDKD